MHHGDTENTEKVFSNKFLERILQCKLNSPRWCHCVGRLTKSRSFQEAYRNAEVGAVDKVENLCAESDLLFTFDREALNDRQIQIEQVAGAKSVAPNSSILTYWRKHAGSIVGRQAQRLSRIASDDNSIGVIQPVGKISVEVHIEDAIDSERLAGLKLTSPRKLQSSEQGAKRATTFSKTVERVNKIVSHSMTRVEICRAALRRKIGTVLRQS